MLRVPLIVVPTAEVFSTSGLRLIAEEAVARAGVEPAVILPHADMRTRPVRRVALLQVVPGFHRTPNAVDFDLNAVGRRALVILAELAAILVVAAPLVLLVHPVLVIGVMALVMLLRLSAKRRQRERRHEKPAHAVLLIEKELTAVSLVSRFLAALGAAHLR